MHWSYVFTTAFLLSLGLVCKAQERLPFGSVEACFEDGRLGYTKAFRSKLRWPHDSLMTKQNLGTVYFDVELDTLGHIVDFVVLRSPNPLLDQEVRTKLLATQGLWRPLVVDGRATPCIVREHVYFEFR